MGLLGGLIGKLIALAVLLLILVVVAAGGAYAADVGVEATVIDKNCTVPEVMVRLKAAPIERAVEVTADKCSIIQKNNFVVYHVRSERTIIYDREGGQCLFDTKSGAGCVDGSGGDGDGGGGLPFP